MKITKYGSFQFLAKIWNVRFSSTDDPKTFKILYANTSLYIPIEVADKILLMSDDIQTSTKYRDAVSTVSAKYLHRRNII